MPAKIDRMQRHIAASERKRGKRAKRANRIAWARLNKLGLLRRGKRRK